MVGWVRIVNRLCSTVFHVGDDRGGRGGTRPRAWRPGGLRHSGGSAESCCLPAL